VSDDYKEFISEFQSAITSKFDKTRLKIMVLGPNIDEKNNGAKLRKFIVEKCQEYAVAIRGEHKELVEMYKQIVGAGSHLCVYELDLAEQMDAIIIIPDSAGSLVELGMFANMEDICRRTLVLFSDEYGDENKPSFINLGPQLAYKNQGGKVRFVRYIEKEQIWDIVKGFIQIFKANKVNRERFRS
jgi:hypothetical protein